MMDKFVSLARELDKYFDGPASDIPSSLRALMEAAFPLGVWDNVSPDWRRHYAAQWDDQQHDPAKEDERKRAWNSMSEKNEIKRQIRELELMRAQTPLELESKSRQLQALEEKIRAVDEKVLAVWGNAPVSGEGASPEQKKLATSQDIAHYFRMRENDGDNWKWWDQRFRNATRSPSLIDCRAQKGKNQGQPSLWRPECIAAWLSEKHFALMPKKKAAAILRQHFPEYNDAADHIELSDD